MCIHDLCCPSQWNIGTQVTFLHPPRNFFYLYGTVRDMLLAVAYNIITHACCYVCSQVDSKTCVFITSVTDVSHLK